MSTLVLAEHDNADLKDATLATITAAGQLGGDVHVLVAGSGCGSVAEAAAKVAGVAKVLVADDAAYGAALPENLAPLIAGLMAGYDAFVAPATSRGKNVAPRVAAALKGRGTDGRPGSRDARGQGARRGVGRVPADRAEPDGAQGQG
jgi:electron transfer flavoprotein alpha subunit